MLVRTAVLAASLEEKPEGLMKSRVFWIEIEEYEESEGKVRSAQSEETSVSEVTINTKTLRYRAHIKFSVRQYDDHWSPPQTVRNDILLDYEIELATRLIAGLQQLPGLHVHGITDPRAMNRRVPTVIFTVDGMQPVTIAEALAARNIFVWHGHNYAIEAASHINILDAGGAVRIGPVHYNSMAEIDTLLEVLTEILPAAAVA